MKTGPDGFTGSMEMDCALRKAQDNPTAMICRIARETIIACLLPADSQVVQKAAQHGRISLLQAKYCSLRACCRELDRARCGRACSSPWLALRHCRRLRDRAGPALPDR